MILAALIDAGVPINVVEQALAKLNVHGITLSHSISQRGGVRGTSLSVGLDEQGKKPRSWQELVNVVEASNLSVETIERACIVLMRLVEAEAMAHASPISEVHLHELGQIDTLVDVVGVIAGLEWLGVERLYSSPLPSGSGIIQSAHGLLPIPSPATSALMAMAKAPVVPPLGNATDTGEMVTPTGAAIITTLATFRQPSMTLESLGYGLGAREISDRPNVLGLWIGQESGSTYSTELTIIETNLDDISGEILGYVQERLFNLGARDVWFTPIHMKKNRPGTMLSAIVPIDLESQAVTLVMKETSTLGVRVRSLARYEAERERVEINTSLGTIWVKIKRLNGKRVEVYPEYEECRQVALSKDLPLMEVYRLVQREAEHNLI